MTAGERDAIRKRAGGRCEYCHLPDFAMAPEDFHVEHVHNQQPAAEEGARSEQQFQRFGSLQCADDADFVTGVKTLFNNDHDNSSGLGVGKDKEYIEANEGKLVDCSKVDGGKPVKTRYIRLYTNGNTSNEMNHFIEVEVYGRPAK